MDLQPRGLQAEDSLASQFSDLYSTGASTQGAEPAAAGGADARHRQQGAHQQATGLSQSQPPSGPSSGQPSFTDNPVYKAELTNASGLQPALPGMGKTGLGVAEQIAEQHMPRKRRSSTPLRHGAARGRSAQPSGRAYDETLPQPSAASASYLPTEVIHTGQVGASIDEGCALLRKLLRTATKIPVMASTISTCSARCMAGWQGAMAACHSHMTHSLGLPGLSAAE